jgi:hypothetical protein
MPRTHRIPAVIFRRSFAMALLCVGVCSVLAASRPAVTAAAEPTGFVPRPLVFPPLGSGTALSGELVQIDHVNRRGALRLFGDFEDNRYHAAASHRFALLPYAVVRYHGAPAELRDIPIGTVLHGQFVLPPEGSTVIPAPEKGQERYVPPQNHAFALEDDFSFYESRGRAWKVAAIELKYDSSSRDDPPGSWRQTPSAGTLRVAATGTAAGGLMGEQTFSIDRSTRVWRGRELVDWEDLAPESAWQSIDQQTRIWRPDAMTVQVNLTWHPRWSVREFHAADVWCDEESRNVARERQRQLHRRHMLHRWLPGWIDEVEHEPGGGGVVTLTLFGGMDQALYDLVRSQAPKGSPPGTPQGSLTIAVAEPTLRTWWQEHDSKGGPVLEVKELPQPPLGSSGIQVRVRIPQLLDGYRPGRIVRVRTNAFANVKLPPEERVKGLEDR